MNDEQATEQTITREEWESRYAQRLIERGGVPEAQAKELAQGVADQNLADNGDLWLDPEDDADVEMSYWEDDGDA